MIRRKNKEGQWIFKNWDGDMDRIDLVEERDRWRTTVNATMNTAT
jgi:hypothetical protein